MSSHGNHSSNLADCSHGWLQRIPIFRWEEEHARWPDERENHIMPLVPEGTRENSAPAMFKCAPSYAQERLWFVDRLNPGQSVYNVPAVRSLSGPVNYQALQEALNFLVLRHESLRTTFEEEDGKLRQVVHPFGSRSLPVIDLRGMEARWHAEQVAQLTSCEAQAPFDLHAGPLFRFGLILLSDNEALLVLTFHHVICDGWSLSILHRELEELYGTFLLGGRPSLPALDVQYADYAAWQRAQLTGVSRAELLDYWRQKMAGAPRVLELPADRRRPAKQTFRGAFQPFSLSERATQAVRELARREQATPFMVLLAAYAVVLGRSARSEDVVVGTPISTRTRSELEPVVGLFLNTLALRVDLSEAPSFSELVRRVRTTTLQAFEHQELPFGQLVEHLQPERDLSHHPVFQAMFVFQSGATSGGLTGADVPSTQQQEAIPWTSKFDLTLTLVDALDSFAGGVEFNTDLFDLETIRRLVERFQLLVLSASAEAEHRISELPCVPEPEARWLARAARGRDGWYPDATTHERFSAIALERRNSPAVVCGEESISYAELDTRSNQLANLLLSWGVLADECVGVCMHRSIDLVVSFLAIHKAGAAFLALDPSHPTDRLEYLLDDAGVRTLLGQEVTGPVMSVLGSKVSRAMLLDRETAVVSEMSVAKPDVALSPDRLAYVIYTSGSTGRPKGVMVSHRALLNHMAWLQLEFGLRWDDTVLQKTPCTFDVSVWEFFWPLLVGARLVLAQPGRHTDPEYLTQEIQQHCVSVVYFVATALQMFLDVAHEATCPSLKRVFCGGEAMPPSLPGLFFARFPGAALHNIYGPTETAIDVTWWSPRPDGNDEGVPIGRPIDNTEVLVLDSELKQVPIGVVGELYVGGPSLARGYLGAPRLTADRFIPHPRPKRPGERLYRTGDLGRIRQDGALMFLGRTDHQVKVRGHRIELGEIEATIYRLEGVRDCAVLVEDGGQRLLCYLVLDARMQREVTEVRESCRRALPEYMVPSLFLEVPEIPRSASGKLDRAALPTRRESSHEVLPIEPPVGRLEGIVARIWADVLETTSVGRHESFFDLGGHSLLATQIIARISSQLETKLPLSTIFEAPTVAGLAAELRRVGPHLDLSPESPLKEDLPQTVSGHEARTQATTALPSEGHRVAEQRGTHLSTVRSTLRGQPDEPRSREAGGALDKSERLRSEDGGGGFALSQEGDLSGPLTPLSYPLSLGQQRLWFLQKLAPRHGAYNVSTTLRIRGSIEPEPLQQALEALCRRHEVLRMRVEESQEGPVAVILQRVRLPFSWGDLSGLSAEQRMPTAQTQAIEESRLPFDLTQGPLFRVRAFRLALDDHLLVMTFHHLVTDEWSVAIMVRELGELYATGGRVEAGAVEKPSGQYSAFVSWEQEFLAGPAFEAGLAYWKRQLEGAPPSLRLPVSASRRRLDRKGAIELIELPAEISAGVISLARGGRASVFMVLFAALSVQLRFETGQKDLVIGSPIANRAGGAFEDTVGFFVNTLALRLQVDDRATFSQTLEQARRTCFGAYEHQAVPLNLLIQELGTKGDVAENPLFQVFLQFQNTPGASTEDVREAFLLGNGAAKFDLLWSFRESQGSLAGFVEYDVDLFSRGYVQGLISRLTQLLARASELPDRPISDLRSLASEDRTILEKWWKGPAQPAAGSVVCAIKARAEDSPESPALVVDRQELSYRELLGNSRRLVTVLKGRGLRPGESVGLMGPPSVGLYVALLSLFGMGVTVVPVNAQDPPDRSKSLLAASGMKLLLSSKADEGALMGLIDTLAICDLETEAASADESELIASPAWRTAYVVFTSGSTGQPKGVNVSHGVFANLMNWHTLRTGSAPPCRTLQLAPMSFDVAFQEVFSSWMAGAPLVATAEPVRSDPQRLLQLMLLERIQRLFLPYVLLQELAVQSRGQAPLKDLREVITAGEQLRVTDEIRAFFQQLPQATLSNQYGPSETHVVSEFVLGRAHGYWPELPPIGRPIGNCRLYVLDDELRPLPVGQVGELYVGGVSVESAGYSGQPGLTARSFVPDPFREGARMYRTLDLATFDEDGELVFAGRADTQLKIRGFRVEPGDIENTLLKHPAVWESAIVPARDSLGNQSLVAYVRGAVSSGELRRFLADRLPRYLVPETISVLEALPKTSSGKIDRRALGLRAVDKEVSEWIAPQGEFEEQLAEIWADVLQVERVGRGDDFFALGGHSLLAVRVQARVKADLGVEMEIGDLFSHSTLEVFATSILERLARSIDPEAAAELLVAWRENQPPSVELGAPASPPRLPESLS